MQLEALKVFCDVADLRSFSKAAEANQRTQSAVSRMLQELENRLGVQLIDRSRRTLPLTPLGRVYYEGCKRLLDQFLELETSIRHARTQMALTVRVAAIYSVGLGDIRQHVERFEQQHAHVKVHIDYLHPTQVYERIRGGSSDLGLVSYPRPSRDLTVLPWREEEMVLACTPTHPLARRTAIDPGVLAGEKFVAFEKGLVIRQEVDRFLRRHGVGVQVVLEFDNIENIKKGIEIGAGVALLPEPTLRQEVLAGSLRAVRLSGCQLRRPLGIIHRRHHRLGSSALAFIELLQTNGAASESGSKTLSSDLRFPTSDFESPQAARGKRKVP
jgi:DNA-binding transcriptional LysR family regulator